MEKELLEKIAEVEENHWWYVARGKLVESLISSLPRNIKILDVGAGTGINFPIFSKLGDVVGLEPWDKAREIAKNKGFTNIVNGRAEKIPFPNGSFDLLVALDVLEHLPDDVKALKEFHRVLKRKGCLVVTVPAFSFLWSEHDNLNKHFRRYSRGELVRRMEKCGFKVEKASYFFFFLFPFFVVSRLLSRIGSKFFKKLSYHELSMPPRPINNLLISLLRVEVWLLFFFSFPWGSSLLVKAFKQDKN